MTRKEIEKDYDESALFHYYLLPDPGEVINFALEMVRKHNEECAQIAGEYLLPELVDDDGKHLITEAIKEVKP